MCEESGKRIIWNKFFIFGIYELPVASLCVRKEVKWSGRVRKNPKKSIAVFYVSNICLIWAVECEHTHTLKKNKEKENPIETGYLSHICNSKYSQWEYKTEQQQQQPTIDWVCQVVTVTHCENSTCGNWKRWKSVNKRMSEHHHHSRRSRHHRRHHRHLHHLHHHNKVAATTVNVVPTAINQPHTV